MQLCGTWDRSNPRLLGQQPGERDLGRCRLLPFPDAGEQVNQGLIRLQSLRREARQGAAEVGAVELRIFVDLARQEALAQGAVRDKADSEFLKGRYHFLLWSPRPQRVFALESSDRLDCVCATDGLHSCFGKAEVLDLAFLNQVLHRSSYVFDRHMKDAALDISAIFRAFGLETMLTDARRSGPRLSDGMSNRPFPVVFGIHRTDETVRHRKSVV